MKYRISIVIFLFLTANLFGQKDSISLNMLYNKAYGYVESNPDMALKMFDTILDISKKKDSSIFSARANYCKGMIYSDKGKYETAVLYYKKAIENYKATDNKKGVASSFVNIGNTFQFIGNHSKAISCYLEAVPVYEDLDDAFSLSVTYGSLANIFLDLEQTNDAKKYFSKALFFAKSFKDSSEISYAYYNMSVPYTIEKKYDSVFVYLKKSKEFLNKSSTNQHRGLINYGEAYYYLNSDNTKMALKKAYKGLTFIEKSNEEYYLAVFHLLIGKIYLEQNKLEQAYKQTYKSLRIAESSGNKSTLINVYSQLSEIYLKRNNDKKAFFYKDLENKQEKDVLGEKQKKNINFLNIKFETERKDKEIIQQQLELEQKDKEIQKKKTQNNYMIGLTSFLVVSSILIWFLFQQRQKRKNQEIVTLKREHQIKSLELLIEGEEKERLRIAKELHDGVNGDLSAIKYKLTSMQEMNNKIINEAVEMIDKSCKQVRAISHNLVPPSLESFNIIEATEIFCENMNAIHQPKINFQHIGENPKINKKDEINVFRIIQELVSNSIKHADATEIDVQLSYREKQLQITVEDNGKGFDNQSQEDKGIGLKNIQSRIDYLKATMDVLSNNKGTSYTIEIDTNKLNDN